jgi:flagellar M-ring protein FliF
VASSVEGLRPENISILDYDGNLLSSKTESDALAGLSKTQLGVRKDVENYLEDKAQSMLDGVVGAGKSIVRVTAELDFQQLERTSEQFDPNSAVVRSEEKTEESKSSNDKQEELAESADQSQVETSVTNYEINKTVEHLIESVGNIKRLSVAVMLDGVYQEVENAEGIMEIVYEPRPQDEIDRISAIVKNAIGFDADRNDQIEVVNLPFDKTSMEYEQGRLDQIYQQEFYFDIAKKIGLVLLAALAFLYLRKRVKRLFSSLSHILPAGTSPGVVESHTYERQESEETPVPKIEPEKRKPKLIDQMQNAAKDRPEEIAKVIKTMMID